MLHNHWILTVSLAAIGAGCLLAAWVLWVVLGPAFVGVEERTEEETVEPGAGVDDTAEPVEHVGATEAGLQIPARVSAQMAAAEEEAAIDKGFADLIASLRTEPDYLAAFVDTSMRLPAYRALRLEATQDITEARRTAAEITAEMRAKVLGGVK